MRIALCCLLLAGSVGAEPNWKKRLDESYARAGAAAEIMYVDGVLSNRHPEYQLFSLENQRMDLSLERQRFRELFDSGLRVRFEARVQQMKAQQDGSALALVDEVMAVEKVDEKSGQLYTERIYWRVVDRWEMWAGQPRIRRSRLHWQRYGKGGALTEGVSLWPPEIAEDQKPLWPQLKRLYRLVWRPREKP